MGCSEREKTLCLGVPLPGDTERVEGDKGGGGGSIYLGAELGCLITPSIMAALNKRASEEMRFHLHCCCFDSGAL